MESIVYGVGVEVGVSVGVEVGVEVAVDVAVEVAVAVDVAKKPAKNAEQMELLLLRIVHQCKECSSSTLLSLAPRHNILSVNGEDVVFRVPRRLSRR